MIALIQRVSEAAVIVERSFVGSIAGGLLAMIGVVGSDDEAAADRLLQRLLDYRVFPDPDGRMNLSLREVRGGLLLVPQFTLAADTRSGNRPGFSSAAPPQQAEKLFDYLLRQAQAAHSPVASGRFGAHMSIPLVNDGPVTFWLDSGGQGAKA